MKAHKETGTTAAAAAITTVITIEGDAAKSWSGVDTVGTVKKTLGTIRAIRIDEEIGRAIIAHIALITVHAGTDLKVLFDNGTAFLRNGMVSRYRVVNA